MPNVDLYNKNLNGILINDEHKQDVGVSIFELDHDTILESGNFEIWTGSGKTGTELIKGSDYALDTKIDLLSNEAPFDVYRYIRLINSSYQSGDLYITYDTVGDFVQANDINEIYNNYKARGDVDLNNFNLLNVNKINPGEKVYGIEWNKTQDSYRRLQDAEDLSVIHARTPGYKDSDFDDIFPWNKIKRCNLADNITVNSYYGDPDYAENGSNGQVMDEIPKFYYKFEKETDTSGDKIYRWFITENPKTGFTLFPAFIRNGKVNDYIYIAAFEAHNNGGVLESVAGVQPTTEQTRATFRSQAEARGPGWTILDMLSAGAYQLLYLIEYANFNSQKEIGKGVVDKASGTVNESEITGYTHGNKSFGDPNDGLIPVSYRGIENPWGNTWKFIDGFVIKDDGYYYTDDITNFNDTGSGYQRVAVTPITSDGYADDIEDDMGFGFIPSSTTGTSSTYLTDYFYAHDTGEVNIALLGSSWYDTLQAGVGSWYLYYVASNSSRNVSARLFCVKEF
jgi:hypothetical protein